jgi:drug/metabolite transporter (DMT)-like permease
LCSALFLAISFLLLKRALRLGIHPVWAVCVRMSTGLAVLWIVTLVLGKLPPILKAAWTNAGIVRLMLLGASVATVGNCLSAFAMKHTDTGIAATLIGLQPIMVILIIAAADRKPPSLRALTGTLIAFSGAAMIFLR